MTSTRLTASQSFSEAEVRALEEVLGKILRGASRGDDLRAMALSPALINIARKVASMRGAI